MKQSRIFSLLKKIYIVIGIYYENSTARIAMQKTAIFLSKLIKGSRILRFFYRDWQIEKLSKDSVFINIVSIPFKVLKAFSFKNSKNIMMEKSFFIRNISGFFKKIFSINTISIGIFIISAAVGESVMRLLTKNGSVLSTILETAIILVGVALGFVNRPLDALYKGSFVAALASDYFKLEGAEDESNIE